MIPRCAVAGAVLAVVALLSGCHLADGSGHEPSGSPASSGDGCGPGGWAPLCGGSEAAAGDGPAPEPEQPEPECDGEPYAGQRLAACWRDGVLVLDPGQGAVGAAGGPITYVVSGKRTDVEDCPWRIFAEGPNWEWVELCTSPGDYAAQTVGSPYQPTDAAAREVYEAMGGAS